MFIDVWEWYLLMFRKLEAEGKLHHLNETDLYCLHYVYKPRINHALQAFTESWNNHCISTEGGYTPYQLFIKGAIETTCFQFNHNHMV